MPTSLWLPRLIALATSAAEDDGAHDINHLHRVWRVAQTLLDAHPEADALVVLAGCYLHDTVNVPKDHPDRAKASQMAARLARMFYTAGRMGSALAHPDDPLASARELDDTAFSLDHIEVKLARLPAMMNTAAARRLGEERVAWLRAFRAVFVAEWGASIRA